MIEAGDHFRISNWDKHQNVDGLDKIREKNRLRQQKFRERQKQKLLENNNVIDNVSNALEKELDIDKDKEEDKDINKEKEVKEKEQNLNEFFDSVWKLYPSKHGKSGVKKKRREILRGVGYESLRAAISRYKDYVEKTRRGDFKELSYMHGSTFFNGRYEDYLDENYEEEVVKPKKSIQKDNDFMF